jgi:hypothetical protein
MKLKVINKKIRDAMQTAARCCAAATATDSLEIARAYVLLGVEHICPASITCCS